MDVFRLTHDDPRYPAALRAYLGNGEPVSLAAVGDLALLRRRTFALFCSVRCPGDLVLQTCDLAQNLRGPDVAVISGFHSPVERECLAILLRRSQPVIVCPARSIAGMRIRAAYRKPLDEKRLLLLSPFPEKQRRITERLSLERNRLVAALAGAIFVAHAEPGGRTEKLCLEVLGWRKPLYTLESGVNAHLVGLGARPVREVGDWAMFV